MRQHNELNFLLRKKPRVRRSTSLIVSPTVIRQKRVVPLAPSHLDTVRVAAQEEEEEEEEIRDGQSLIFSFVQFSVLKKKKTERNG